MRIALAHNLKRTDTEEEAEFDSPETIATSGAVIASLGHDVAQVEVSCPVHELVDRLYDLRLKHEDEHLVETEVPADLARWVIAKLVDLSRSIFRELSVVGHGRADFRVTPAGEIYFLKVNPLPDLSIGPDAEIYKAAALIEKSVVDVIECIILTAARRFD